jgi:hypothetical protein
MAFFLGIAALLIVTSSNRARHGIMASPPSFRISSEMPFGPTDLFLPIAANLFLIIFVLTTKGSPEVACCIWGMLRSPLSTEE